MWRCLLNRGRVEALPVPKFVSKAASLPQCPAAGQRASTWEEDVHLYVWYVRMYVWLIYAGLGGSVTHGGDRWGSPRSCCLTGPAYQGTRSCLRPPRRAGRRDPAGVLKIQGGEGARASALPQ